MDIQVLPKCRSIRRQAAAHPLPSPRLPWYLRRQVFSFLPSVSELYKVSQLSRIDRVLLINNKVINQDVHLKQFKRRINNSDLKDLQYLIALATKLPKFLFIDHFEFDPYIQVFEQAYSQNPSKVVDSTVRLRIRSNFFEGTNQE